MAKQRQRISVRRDRPLVLLSGLSIDIVRGAVEMVRGWDWDLRNTSITPDEWPADKPVAGALIGELPTQPLARRLIEERCPAVRIGILPHPDDKMLPAVLPDQAASGRLAAEHYEARGFKNVAFVGFDPDDPGSDFHVMYAAFRRRSEELGMACQMKRLLDPLADVQPKYVRRIAVLSEWLKGLPKPVGVFTYDDIMAARILLACTKAGLTVPEEVALLGYGNSVQCEVTAVGLSSVDPAAEDQTRTALQLLHRMMDGARAPKDPVMVPPRGIVERRSTDVLAVPDPAVARALRFIWDNFEQNLSIGQIAEAAGMPRRSLERGFRQHLDRSVHAELARKRVAELRRLLLTTKAPLADLAPRAGFFTLANAHRSFRRAYGIPPNKYRMQHRDGTPD